MSLSQVSEVQELPWMTCRRFLSSGIVHGQRTLDVGCGEGDLMEILAAGGAAVQGIEYDPIRVEQCREKGFNVQQGIAESLPFEDASFDRIICSVVLPYTDERLAIREWARVLKPGGRVFASYHGSGYVAEFLTGERGVRRIYYGFRMVVNTICYRLSGRRLPGKLGDTLFQSPRALRRYYREAGLVLEEEVIAGRNYGLPRYFCHRLVRP